MKNENSDLIKISGIVERITFHNAENGWTVLKFKSFSDQHHLITVIVYHEKVFAGATVDFYGKFIQHPKHGEQFQVSKVVEKKPATAQALEKYLGSGLIKGVGPGIAKRIVKYFNKETLDVFEFNISRLKEVDGIAEKKLIQIQESWESHKSIRDVMLFLQEYGISTLFATKIFKTYGAKSIEVVKENPYRLAEDIYGIGFFSSDKIALLLGMDRLGVPRIKAAIKHVLASSRDEGHCYLTESQIVEKTPVLLKDEIGIEFVKNVLNLMIEEKLIRVRIISDGELAYYSKSLYYDEEGVAFKIKKMLKESFEVDERRIESWIKKYAEKNEVLLSDEQKNAVINSVKYPFFILTGGPGCGKTTSTKVLVKLLLAMSKKILLAAPTGRAAQRMSEVIGLEVKTIHRLLEWIPAENKFKHNEENKLSGDVLILDETSMLDISLTHAVLKAINDQMQVVLIGDPDQLPSVGAGNVLQDLLRVPIVPRSTLTQVFRQAAGSSIVTYAHDINKGQVPEVASFIKSSKEFHHGLDCFFLDSDEATKEQANFIKKIKAHVGEVDLLDFEQLESEDLSKDLTALIPPKFAHVNIDQLLKSKTKDQELKEVLKKVHPWSSLNFGLTATESLLRIYKQSLPELFQGQKLEIQVLCPQTRGTMGTKNLNEILQLEINPPHAQKKEIRIGDRLYREGDRVIQTKNNYDLEVFNGDIGFISLIDPIEGECSVRFSSKGVDVIYSKTDLVELNLAYAITVHKSQGSEFPIVIIPVFSQHFNMLFRNLIYTALTRAKKVAIFIGNRRAFRFAISRIDNRERQTFLSSLINS